MLVRELTTSPAITVREEDQAARAVDLLDKMSITCLPVVDASDRLVGVVGESDVIRRVVDTSGASGQHRRASMSIRDVMTRDVLTIDADASVGDALALMNGTGLKSLPVVIDERVVGMLSRRDIVRAIARGELEADGCQPADA